MSGLKSKLLIVAILAATATATAGCDIPLTIDCTPYVCTG